jgi:class 3 adenylate cyclase/hemoglobin-like flavoprotein
MPSIRYLNGNTIPAQSGQTILQAAVVAKERHMQECGGFGRCTTCRVQVIDGLDALEARTPEERAIAERKGWGIDTRLACQAKVLGDVTVKRLVEHRSDLLTFAMNEADQPAGVEKEVAVMFCDLRNFTTISESMLPHDVMYIVNSYATEASEAILQNDGYIDKYMGDGIMAVFGLRDKDRGRVCRNAVRAALNIQKTAENLTAEIGKSFDIEFHIGVGIHFGSCVVGQVGHPSRQSLSLLGDTVNAAARIESATKDFDTHILISEAVRAQAPDAFELGAPSAMNLKGKDEALTLYPVEGMAEVDHLMLVQQVLPDVLKHRSEVGMRFYDLLFSRHPEYREMFPKDMAAQADSLITMLESAVISACRPGDMISGLHELGRRHVAYGVVKREDFERVGECLIETLREFLGDRVTPDIVSAWKAIFTMVADAILEGVEDALKKGEG